MCLSLGWARTARTSEKKKHKRLVSDLILGFMTMCLIVLFVLVDGSKLTSPVKVFFGVY